MPVQPIGILATHGRLTGVRDLVYSDMDTLPEEDEHIKICNSFRKYGVEGTYARCIHRNKYAEQRINGWAYTLELSADERDMIVPISRVYGGIEIDLETDAISRL